MPEFDSLDLFEPWIKDQAAYKDHVGKDGECHTAAAAIGELLKARNPTYVGIRAWMGDKLLGHMATVIVLNDGTRVCIDPTASQPSLDKGAVTLRDVVVPYDTWESTMEDWVGKNCAAILRDASYSGAESYTEGWKMEMASKFDVGSGGTAFAGTHGQSCGCVIL